jgi:hypothetical protein
MQTNAVEGSGARGMATRVKGSRAQFCSPTRRAELEAKQELDQEEAAEYLDMSPGRLYNLLVRARTPGCAGMAPKRITGGAGFRNKFSASELKAWKKLRGRC